MDFLYGSMKISSSNAINEFAENYQLSKNTRTVLGVWLPSNISLSVLASYVSLFRDTSRSLACIEYVIGWDISGSLVSTQCHCSGRLSGLLRASNMSIFRDSSRSVVSVQYLTIQGQFQSHLVTRYILVCPLPNSNEGPSTYPPVLWALFAILYARDNSGSALSIQYVIIQGRVSVCCS